MAVPWSDNLLEICYSGADALAKLEEGTTIEGSQYKLILTDISMPGMDGYELAANARKVFANYSLPKELEPTIIALTGHAEVEFLSRALIDMDQVYTKPISSK
mmetsp:Transcript_28109/g.42524  ORF Transcript_28109/g.42524 Transcript_28109/m.42524 type:complete len:103 (+) Transcript_28109:358-666(+)|eukprot:CAMPEP_0170485630 /NCGR_PEP_ID=MMETSP0208-20121228/4858_1 /TAXON_ID=197538 /ORGANISM="Strombidium inclinatum, Strain S3" /LENGTH=102 /DNA_ID=CAMNT_0010759337 /DNA_START=2752 /DNA_END=3060 /DNA_ORIENTATION=-